jgi:uncharacterized protein YbaR (Trm112 family)
MEDIMRIVICPECRTPVEYDKELTHDLAKIIVLFHGQNKKSQHAIVVGDRCCECEV